MCSVAVFIDLFPCCLAHSFDILVYHTFSFWFTDSCNSLTFSM